jgi:hypothetical protein
MNTKILKASLAACLIGCLAACSDGLGPEVVVSGKYSNYKEAEKSGVLQSGWLPRELPLSAHNISEVHSVDSNEMWVSFEVASSDVKRFLAKCTPSSQPALPDRRRTLRSVPWWRSDLTSGQKTKPSKVDFYLCSNMTHASSSKSGWIAMEHDSSRIWYWV